MYNKNDGFKFGGESMKNANRKMRKIYIISLICVLFCTFILNISYGATQQGSIDFDTNLYKPDSTLIDSKGEKQLQNLGQSIVGPIRIVGSFVSVLTLIIIGVKYMLGSVEERAEYKKSLLPYFWGAIMVFGITNIVSVIYNIAINI